MGKRLTTIFMMACMLMSVNAETGTKQQLTQLFKEAERCYLTDDYQQLYSLLNNYADTFKNNYEELGDSIDVYRAYYAKMCGAYYYGFAEEESSSYYSEYCYRNSLDVFNNRVETKTISGMHPNAVTLHQELAQLYYKVKRYSHAKEQLDTVYNYYENKLYEGIDSVTPHYYNTISQLAMCNARLGNFDLALSQIDEAINDYFKKKKNKDYFETLRRRGKIMMLQADSLGTTRYKKAIDCYQQYVEERYRTISSEMNDMDEMQRGQYWLAIHQFLFDCFRLGNLAPEMLYDLSLFSKDYLVRKNPSLVKWKQVRQALRKNECAIEFVQYFGKNDEKRMGCLVLRNTSKKPEFIDLFSTDSLLQQRLTAYYSIGDAITSSLITIKDTLYNDQRLASMIWSPKLMTAIGNANQVYFSPDGMLHQLAIEYMMPDTNKVCYRLSSTRMITQKRNTPKLESALFCGGIDYEATYNPVSRNNDVIAYRFLSPQTTSISSLPGTRKEVDSIYTCRQHPQDTLLVGQKASDENLLRLLKKSFQVVHLSTHGYFGGKIGIFNDIKPLSHDESMSKSGLLFAGSANTLTDKNFDEEMFDGVLSATELSKQDFSKTELIVLSACQTGLGHLTDDGVYGIQRGLKLAGAHAMILSLWNVNDNSSNLLMRFFYEELERQLTKDIHAAFLAARRRLMNEEKISYQLDIDTFTIKIKTEKLNKPSHLNPFIIIDAF